MMVVRRACASSRLRGQAPWWSLWGCILMHRDSPRSIMPGPHTSVLGALARLGTHSGAFGPQTRAFNPHTRMLGPQTRPTTIVENHGDMDATGTVAVWALAPLVKTAHVKSFSWKTTRGARDETPKRRNRTLHVSMPRELKSCLNTSQLTPAS